MEGVYGAVLGGCFTLLVVELTQRHEQRRHDERRRQERADRWISEKRAVYAGLLRASQAWIDWLERRHPPGMKDAFGVAADDMRAANVEAEIDGSPHVQTLAFAVYGDLALAALQRFDPVAKGKPWEEFLDEAKASRARMLARIREELDIDVVEGSLDAEGGT